KPAYDHLRSHILALSELIARADEAVLLAPTRAADRPHPVAVEMVPENCFAALHAPMTIGRGIRSADVDRGAEPVAVLNYRFWNARFSGDPHTLRSTAR